MVLDLYSRLVMGWSMSEWMTAPLVCDALRMALLRLQRPRGVIVHSDRSSQYCLREHRTLLDASLRNEAGDAERALVVE